MERNLLAEHAAEHPDVQPHVLTQNADKHHMATRCGEAHGEVNGDQGARGFDQEVASRHIRHWIVAEERVAGTRNTGLLELLLGYVDRNDRRCPHQAHPLNGEQPNRPIANDAAGLIDRQRCLPYGMQRNRCRVDHRHGARIKAIGRLEQVSPRHGDVFGIGAISATAELVVIPAARKKFTVRHW